MAKSWVSELCAGEKRERKEKKKKKKKKKKEKGARLSPAPGYDMVVHGVYKVVGGGEARLKVEVFQTVLEDDVASNPTRLVNKEGNEGSFGFTTEKQGEFRFCFLSEANHVDHVLAVDFTLKVLSCLRCLFCCRISCDGRSGMRRATMPRWPARSI